MIDLQTRHSAYNLLPPTAKLACAKAAATVLNKTAGAAWDAIAYFGLGCERSHSVAEMAREFEVSAQVIAGILGAAERRLMRGAGPRSVMLAMEPGAKQILAEGFRNATYMTGSVRTFALS